MAILTVLDDEEVARAAAAFGVALAERRDVLGGSVNTNLEIRAQGGGRFFLRLYEEQGRAGAEREARLLAALARAGVPTPAPLVAQDGQPVIELRGKPAAMFPFVAGSHRCQASLSTADCAAVGRALAEVHLVGESLADPTLTAESRFDLAAIAARLAGLPQELPPDVAAARDRLARGVEALRGASFAAAPIPLIHGDLFRDNVLFHDAGLALLDFESASRGHASFDLMVTTLAFSYGDGLRLDLAAALCGAYAGRRRPTEPELGELLLSARLACVRFATTRITDYELRPRSVGAYKDFRRWLARLDAVERLGLAGLHALFG